MFRQYRTTAADRAARHAQRDQVNSNGGIQLVNNELSGGAAALAFSSRAPHPHPSQPSRPVPDPHLPATPNASPLSLAPSLLDLENDVLESCAGGGEALLVDVSSHRPPADLEGNNVRFCLPPRQDRLDDVRRINPDLIFVTERNPVASSTHRYLTQDDHPIFAGSRLDVINSPASHGTQYADPNFTYGRSDGRNQPRLPVAAEPLPLQDNVASGHLAALRAGNENSLSKTDRVVVLELIKNIRSCNATDELELVNFLMTVKPIFDIAPRSSREIIKLLLPVVSGQLFKLWLEAITVGVDWDALHREVLIQFLPDLRKREIENQLIERPQGLTEKFADYVESVVGAAYALKTRLSEREVVEVVLTKCSPQTRSHFGFGAAPSTIAELQILANRVSSSVNAERRYFGSGVNARSQTFFRSVENESRDFQTQVNNDNGRRTSDRGRGRSVTCYRCRGAGHLARSCRANLN